MHSNCVFWAPVGPLGLPAAQHRARLYWAAERRATSASSCLALGLQRKPAATFTLLQRQIVVQQRENHTVVSRCQGGEKREEILLRIFTFHTVKTKQNGSVFHPDHRFICSAKLTKCLLCPRLIAAWFPSAQLSWKGRVQTVREELKALEGFGMKWNACVGVVSLLACRCQYWTKDSLELVADRSLSETRPGEVSDESLGWISCVDIWKQKRRLGYFHPNKAKRDINKMDTSNVLCCWLHAYWLINQRFFFLHANLQQTVLRFVPELCKYRENACCHID